jgi:hypothetical protein
MKKIELYKEHEKKMIRIFSCLNCFWTSNDDSIINTSEPNFHFV